MLLKEFKGPGFTMEVPTNWYISSTPQIQAMFISPPQEGGVQANLMVTMNPVQENVTAESVAKEAKKNQMAQYEQYQIIEEGFIKRTNKQGYQRVYEWFNPNQELKLHQKQIMLVVSNMLYILTTTRPVDTDNEEVLQRFDTSLEMMLQSFKLD